MDESDVRFGDRIAALRAEREWTQRQLGQAAGLSQPSISRLEAYAVPPDDIPILVRVAKALEVPFSELVAGLPPPQGLADIHSETFHAFCPNPLCERNRPKRSRDGSLIVNFNSRGNYAMDLLSELNFCGACGEELIKRCPQCERLLQGDIAKFCVTCGAQISDRPTEEEWEELGERYPPSLKEPDDDLPF